MESSSASLNNKSSGIRFVDEDLRSVMELEYVSDVCKREA